MQGNMMQVYRGLKNMIYSVVFSPDGKSILAGSMDGMTGLWNIKRSLEEYQKSSDHQELSIGQKLKYGILGLNDVLKMEDEKSLSDAAEYYYKEIKFTGKEKRIANINNAYTLYNRLAYKYKNKTYSIMMDSLKVLSKN
jgi:WD40 repeat protein